MPVLSSLRSKFFPPETTVRTIIIYNILQGIYLGYIQVFWQPWLLTIGISVVTIGLLESSSGRGGALSALMQVVGGKYSDSVGRRTLILIGSALLASCWTVSALALAFSNSYLVYLAYILWGLSLLSLPVFDATLADHVESRDRSRVYSTVLIANFIPGSISGYLVGVFGSHTSPQLLLLLAAMLETTGFLLLFIRVRNKPRQEEQIKYSLRDTWNYIKTYRRYFSVFMMDTVSWSISTSILFALLYSRGFTQFEFGLIALSQPIGLAIGTLPGGWLTLRIGPKRLLTISEIFGAAMVFGWALYPLEPLIVVYGFIWGFAIATWAPVQFHLSTKTFPDQRRGEMLGALATTLYLFRIAGPILAAFLYLHLGYSIPIMVGGIGMLATIILIWRFIPSER
ncbi:MAG: MFS transporter [Nitrososphaerales archaeon]